MHQHPNPNTTPNTPPGGPINGANLTPASAHLGPAFAATDHRPTDGTPSPFAAPPTAPAANTTPDSTGSANTAAANEPPTTTANAPNGEPPTTAANTLPAPLARWALVAVSLALGAVILAPVVLSGQDLYRWANAVRGLNLKPGFALLAPVALDLAAVVCIGMVIVGAIWRRERPGLFGLLVWVFAATSAYAQYTHGLAEKHAGRAQAAYWFFPAIAMLGPLLLEVALHRIRRWARQDAGEQQRGAAGFGTRWIPGVAFRETLAAWAASRREGYDQWQDAVAFVRERAALKGLPGPDAVRYAVDALRSSDPYQVRIWLQSRGLCADQAALDAVFAATPPNTHGQRSANEHPAAAAGEHQAIPANEHRAAPANTPPALASVDPRRTANTMLALPSRSHTPTRAVTEQAPTPDRSPRTDTTESANTTTPATDTQVAFVEHHFPGQDWRTNPPSARELSRALGRTSTTPGNNLRKALLARAATERSTPQPAQAPAPVKEEPTP